MVKLVAKITVEDLPLYKDMAEFIIVVACTDDDVPLLIRARAINLGQRIQALLNAAAEQPKEASDGE